MEFISVKELSRSPSKYVNLASRGENIIITKNGRPHALLTEMSSEDLEEFILAKHLDLEREFAVAKKRSLEGKTKSAKDLLAELHKEQRG